MVGVSSQVATQEPKGKEPIGPLKRWSVPKRPGTGWGYFAVEAHIPSTAPGTSSAVHDGCRMHHTEPEPLLLRDPTTGACE